MIELSLMGGVEDWEVTGLPSLEADMTSRRGQPSKAEQPLLPYCRPGPRYVSVSLIGLSLAAVLWWVGDMYQRPPLWHVKTDWHGLVNWVQPIWNAIGQVFGGAGQVLTNQAAGAPLSVRLACLTMLVAFFWSLRRALLARNAYRPGPVDIQPLIDATPEGTAKPQVEDLTARLRKHLSETDLYPPAVLPAEPPEENFLDLVGDVNPELGKLETSLLNLFSRLRPKMAYRVSGVLQFNPHDQKRSHGVTVTITAFATRGSCAQTVWESTWEEAVHEAGFWVMATILPVTQAGNAPPWQAWQGRTLPPELFAAYQKGRELSLERKFDGALHHFYKAERWDPTNLFLRTQVAEVQEKLGLHLDALETYHGALTLGKLHTEEENCRLWKSCILRRFTYLWRWRQRPGVLQARHRYAVLLGTGEILAHEWCSSEQNDGQRRRALDEIRNALAPAFADRYYPAIARSNPDDPRSDWANKWIYNQLKEPKSKENVRLVFQLAALEEMRRLAQDYTVASIFPKLRADKRALTRSALRINRDAWATLRLDLAYMAHPKTHNKCTEYHIHLPNPWARPKLEKRVKRARRLFGFLWQRHHHWQDHYNAACVYAVALNHPDTGESNYLANLAYRELEAAVRGAESGFVRLKRSWLLSEDPDLAALRKHDQTGRLARLEREVYPHYTPDRKRFEDPKPIDIEMAISNSTLLQDISRVMEQVWHRRDSQQPVSVYNVIKWFEDEKDAWERIHRVTSSQARNWPDRERLLQKIQEIADPTLLTEIPGGVPEFNDILDDKEELRESEDAKEYIHGFDERLKLLDDLINPDKNTSPLVCSIAWLSEVKKSDVSGAARFQRATLRKVCAGYAATWQILRDLVDPDELKGGDHQLEKVFHKPLKELSSPSRLMRRHRLALRSPWRQMATAAQLTGRARPDQRWIL